MAGPAAGSRHRARQLGSWHRARVAGDPAPGYRISVSRVHQIGPRIRYFRFHGFFNTQLDMTQESQQEGSGS